MPKNLREYIWQLEWQIKQLRKLIVFDELTKVLNRRGFKDAAMRKFRSLSGKPSNRERRKGAPVPDLCIIFFDVDNFKKINDTYGHHAGDNVLKRVADVLRETVRTTDITGRWGGEEFVVALPNTKVEDAAVVAEKVRGAIENLKVTSHHHKIPVTISVGVCKYDWQKHQDLFALVHDADQAMYEAKQAGKNRVVIASP